MNQLQTLRSVRGVQIAAALFAAAVAAMVFAGLADEVAERSAVVIDSVALDEALEHREHGWTTVFETVSWLAGLPLALAVAALAVVLAVRGRSSRPLLLVGATAGTALAAAWVAKQFFARPRPAAAVQVIAETGYSFPSMHTTATAALVTIAAYMLARRSPGRAGLAWWPVAAVFAVAVAASRVYLGVHWLTDVAAAVALGAGTAAAVIALDLAAPTVGALMTRRRSVPTPQ